MKPILKEQAGFCEFKKFKPSKEWVYWPDGWPDGTPKSKRMLGPAYGEPPRNQPIKRCPLCNKRLKLKAIFCIGGEFTCWELPDHKPRETRKPGPKRQSKQAGRGK